MSMNSFHARQGGRARDEKPAKAPVERHGLLRADALLVQRGLAASRTTTVTLADGVWRGGLSGVAFGADVALVSRVTQGCQPVGPTRTITRCQANVVEALDGQPALPLLLQDLQIADLADHRSAAPSCAPRWPVWSTPPTPRSTAAASSVPTCACAT